MEAAGPSDAQAWVTIGNSREGRPLRACEAGTGARRIYVIGGIHGDEREGGQHVQAWLEELRSTGLPEQVTLRVLLDLNPDGSFASSRTNAQGIDLNRNWPARNFRPGRGRGPEALSEPEVRAAHTDMLAFEPDLVIVLHSAGRGPFVNYDGPARDQAILFSEAAVRTDKLWHVEPDMGYATPGSLGSWVGIDKGIPFLTIEFRRGNPEGANGSALRAGMGALLRED